VRNENCLLVVVGVMLELDGLLILIHSAMKLYISDLAIILFREIAQYAVNVYESVLRTFAFRIVVLIIIIIAE
jgi:hypothetical protein